MICLDEPLYCRFAVKAARFGWGFAAMRVLTRQADLDYYQQRAEQEIALAQTSPHPQAVQAHYLLAGFYLDLVHSSPACPPRPRAALQN